MGKLDKSRTRRDEQRRKYGKMDKRAKDKLVRSPRENEGGQDAQKDLHSRTGRDKKGKTQEKMERGSRKRASSAGSEKMERVGGRQEKMEGHCSTGQSPQWAVVPAEEGEESSFIYQSHFQVSHTFKWFLCIYNVLLVSTKASPSYTVHNSSCVSLQTA